MIGATGFTNNADTVKSRIQPPLNTSPLLTNKKSYPNISTPEYKTPKNKARDEFQVRLLNLSKTGKYDNSHQTKNILLRF